MYPQINVSESQIIIPQGLAVEVSGREYVFSGDLRLNYLDHRGAGAGVYVQNPLGSGSITFPPNLEDGDILQFAYEIVRSLTTRHQSVDRKAGSGLKLTPDEQREKVALEALLLVA